MRHATMVTGVIILEVVLHVHLMSVVLRTPHPPSHIAAHVQMMVMDVDCVRKGITLMMNLVHVYHVHKAHVVQETLTIIPVPQVVMNVLMMR